MESVEIKGVTYHTTEEIADAYMSGLIAISDIPYRPARKQEKKRKTTDAKKQLGNTPIEHKQKFPFTIPSSAEVGSKPVFATLIRNRSDVRFRIGGESKHPYARVPKELLDRPLDEQITAVTKLMPAVLKERSKAVAENFMIFLEERSRRIGLKNPHRL